MKNILKPSINSEQHLVFSHTKKGWISGSMIPRPKNVVTPHKKGNDLNHKSIVFEVDGV